MTGHTASSADRGEQPSTADRTGDEPDHPRLVLLGEDDQVQVRLPLLAEQIACDLAADEPVAEIRRWNATTDLYRCRGSTFCFVSGDREPDRAERLATIRRISDDLRSIIADGQETPHRGTVSRTVRRLPADAAPRAGGAARQRASRTMTDDP